MTGDGVVLTSRDAAEVEAMSVELGRDLQPSNAASRVLLKRFAVLSVRLDRCVEHGDAMMAERVRQADQGFDDARFEAIKVLGTYLEHNPAATVQELKETATGIDWLIKTWLAIKADLGRGGKAPWQRWHLDRIHNLLGRYPGESPPTRFDSPARAGWGDFSGGPAELGTMTKRERKTMARQEVAALIDDEVALLRAMAPTRDPDEEARDRAEARARVVFDPSPEAGLARKYEAAAERGLFRALRDFQKFEGWAEDRPAPSSPAPEPEAEPGPVDETGPDDADESEPLAGKTNPIDAPRPPVVSTPVDWAPAFWQSPVPLHPGLPSIREMTGYGSGGGGPA